MNNEPSKETIYSNNGTVLQAVDCRTKGAFAIAPGTVRVDTDAFRGCFGITAVRIPDTVTHFGWSAFNHCEAIKEVFYEGSVEQWCAITFGSPNANPCRYGAKLYMRGSSKDTLVIPDTIETIKPYAFCGAEKTKVCIPSSVKIIMMGAFGYCKELKEVILTTGLQQIGMEAFVGCDQLESISIPSTVTCIHANAFALTRALKHLFLPKSLLVCDATIALHNLDIEFFCEGGPVSGWDGKWNKVNPSAKTARARTTFNTPFWWYSEVIARRE